MRQSGTLLQAILLVAVLAPVVAADTITGQVVDAQGNGVPGVDIDVKSLQGGGKPVIFNDGTGPAGFFATTLPAGLYRVTFTPPPPPASTHLILEVDDVVVLGTTAMGVLTLPPGVALSGRAVNTAGAPVAGVNLDVIELSTGINLNLRGDTSDALGQFAIAVPTGPIELRLDTGPVAGPLLASQAVTLDLSGSASVGDLVLQPGVRIRGTLLGPGGAPVSGADTDTFDAVSGAKLYTPSDNTNAAGLFDVVVPAGTYDFEICPAFALHLVAFGQASLVVAADVNLGTLNLQQGFVLSGTITGDGAPLAQVDVDVANGATGVQVTLCQDNTNAAGSYAVLVPAGTWSVNVEPPPGLPFDARTVFGVTVAGPTVLDIDLSVAANPPLAVSVSPTQGLPAGGTAVTIAGQSFATDGTASVSFGPIAAAVSSVSSTAIAVVAPPGVHGDVVDVTVSGSNGTSTLTGAFAYIDPAAPLLSAVQPDAALFHQATPVTLTGVQFSAQKLAGVTFGGVPATAVTFVSSTKITCTAPAGTQGQVVDVVVVQSDFSTTLGAAFRYVGTSVASVFPDVGPPGGGPPITINGTFFVDDGSMSASFGNLPATVLSVSPPDSMVVQLPTGAPGSAVDVHVSGSNGSGTLTAGFRYAITGVAVAVPSSGPPQGGGVVTITGEDFVDDASTQVFFGTLQASVLTIDAPHTIMAVAPAGVPDWVVDITVSGANGTGVLPGGYRYGDFSVRGGDAVNGFITVGDVDMLFLDAVAGSKLTLLMKRAKGGLLEPQIRLVGPGEVELVSAAASVVKAKLARVKKFVLPQTGHYRVELSGAAQTTGPYRFRSKLKFPLKSKTALTVQPQATLGFEAMPGWLLKKAAVKGLKTKGNPVVLLPQVSLSGPDGAAIDVTGHTKTSKSGRAVQVLKLPLGALGTHLLEISGAIGTVGPAKVLIRLKAPKTKKTLFKEP